MSVVHGLRNHSICVQPVSVAPAQSWGLSYLHRGLWRFSEFALEHSNMMSNPERDHRQLHGKFYNMSFAIKKTFGQLPCKNNFHLCMCCCLESVWKVLQLDQQDIIRGRICSYK